MNPDLVSAFVETLRAYELLDAVRLAEAEYLAVRAPDVGELARELVKRNRLTTWQANMILNGRAYKLSLGAYILLDLLGEGGMGKVFKARHRVLGRLVALKVIQKSKLGDAEAVRRFQREIQAAAQLIHPNVVLAFDADQHGDRQFFAMEYVDGIDLGRLVKEKGPLLVREACEYIRQAALGLQHAHEQGFVHRDIKPSNLLLTLAKADAVRATVTGAATPGSDPSISSDCFQGLIKISDLGVVRPVSRPSSGDPSKITHDGLVVGTPDFLSPEQARNASRVDIRSDLYSLGCTLFYLLTGKPPFPEGTPTEKLLKHAMDPPPNVRTLRREIPAEVAVIVQKLLSKAPEDRFQVPGALALALEPYSLEAKYGAKRPLSNPFLTVTGSAAPTEADVWLPMPNRPPAEEERLARAERSARRPDWGLWIPLALGFVVIGGILVLILHSMSR
jgi:serine/threonine protein kinase